MLLMVFSLIKRERLKKILFWKRGWIKVKNTPSLNAIFSVIFWYTLTLLVIFIVFTVSKPVINSFVTANIPDAGTKDLNVSYILSNLPLLFWASFLALVLCLVLSMKYKNVHFVFTALLFLYFDIFLLIKNNYEFYILAIRGPYPHYGALGFGLAHLSLFAIAMLSLLMEIIFLKKDDAHHVLKGLRFFIFTLIILTAFYYLYPLVG